MGGNKMAQYQRIHSTVTLEGREQITYGMLCGERVIPDMSTEKEKVDELVSLCNELDLGPVHMQNVVDDWIGVGCQV